MPQQTVSNLTFICGFGPTWLRSGIQLHTLVEDVSVSDFS